jgi:hypothetical protein
MIALPHQPAPLLPLQPLLASAAAAAAAADSLIQQLGSLRKRTDVEQMIGPRVRPPETYDQSYTNSFQYAVRGRSRYSSSSSSSSRGN